MKRLNLILALFALLAIGFYSCQDEELEPPTITVSPPTADAEEGETVSFTVTVAGDQELTEVDVSATTTGAEGTSSDTTFDKGKHSASYSYDYVVPSGLSEGSTVTLTFEVTDKENLTDTASAVINVIKSIDEFTAIMMGGMANEDIGSYLEASTGTVMTADNVEAAKVDVIFTYSTTNGNLFTAPNDQAMIDAFPDVASLSQKNATLFTSALADVDFDAIEKAADIDALAFDATETRIAQTEVGTIFGIQTVNDKYALIEVLEILGTQPSDRGIKIDVKIQK